MRGMKRVTGYFPTFYGTDAVSSMFLSLLGKLNIDVSQNIFSM